MINNTPLCYKFENIQIKLLGDSITHGVGGTGFCQNGEPIVENFSRNPDGFCWAKLFKDYAENKYGCNVINNSCKGADIEFIIKYFDELVDDEDDFVICTIGTNNRYKDKSNGFKPEREEFGTTFYNNILRLNDLFVNRKKKVLFVANIPAAPQNEQDLDTLWCILHMDDINEIYKRASKNAGFALVSMYDLFVSYTEEQDVKLDSLLRDGLHPNDEGYEVMFTILCNELGI